MHIAYVCMDKETTPLWSNYVMQLVTEYNNVSSF